MTDRFEISELLRARAESGAPWLPFLDLPTLTLGVYVVAADDRATHRPHDRDEVYYVLRGRGTLRVEGEDRPVTPESLHFVAAGREHFFHGIEEELTLLVFFAGGANAGG